MAWHDTVAQRRPPPDPPWPPPPWAGVESSVQQGLWSGTCSAFTQGQVESWAAHSTCWCILFFSPRIIMLNIGWVLTRHSSKEYALPHSSSKEYALPHLIYATILCARQYCSITPILQMRKLRYRGNIYSMENSSLQKVIHIFVWSN